MDAENMTSENIKSENFIEDTFKEARSLRLREFSLPSWLTCECSGCKLILLSTDVLSFEVHFEPIFLGDVSFSFFCGRCGSLINMHLKCDLESPADLYRILTSKEIPGRFVNRNEVCSLLEHNVLKKLSLKK